MGYALFYFFKKNLSSFKENKSGAVAFMFVVLFIPIMTLSGGIIDYGKSIGLEKKLESAVDTAILAGAHYVVSSNKKNDKDIENYVKKVFNINFKSDPFYNNGVVLKVSIPPGRTGIEMTATSSSKTNFLQILGINKINVNASGQVKFASTESLDVVLVLDNSGSMQNESKMLNLKNASNNLMTSLFGDVTKNHPSLQIGLVPFSSTIRFPMKYRHALWLDHNGRSPIHSENFAYHMNRFVMIKKLKYAWGGCVEVRPQPYDIHDYDPSKSEMSAEDLKLKTSKNARFFVPWFAPDFPEVSGYGNGILQSNYLTDEHDDAHQATKYP
ncbi:MAG: pilus assembly protein, partial [Alphaproteobacteria bacterium]|nr:pilus assembly protein [Alphaproteobacteria bacterium]